MSRPNRIPDDAGFQFQDRFSLAAAYMVGFAFFAATMLCVVLHGAR